MGIVIPGVTSVVVPNTITVHLGAPNEDAANVTVPFIDYIKNVASSELYPTWPETALRANIYAIISVALNRIFTEWYRGKGYNFDITNNTQFDQSYVHNRGIFDSIDRIVDDIFNDYITRQGQIQPLFAQFCDGRVSQCEGLFQWGTVDLANQGYIPYDILTYYYGNNINIVRDAPVGEFGETYPGKPISLGDVGPYVELIQLGSNTISNNYPAIPKIKVTGTYDTETENAVKIFQSIFDLPQTGIVDKGTWYKARNIYTSVTKLAELTSVGVTLSAIPSTLQPITDESQVVPIIQLVQFFLNVLSAYYDSIRSVDIDGILGPKTRESIIEFQKAFNLPVNGLLDVATYEAMYNEVFAIFETLPPQAIALPSLLFPGEALKLGSTGANVYVMQQYLNYISTALEGIPTIDPDGVYGPETQNTVRAFQEFFGIDPTGVVDQYTWGRIVLIYRRLRFGATTP